MSLSRSFVGQIWPALACHDRIYSIVAILGPSSPRHARYYGTKGTALCASLFNWDVYGGEHDSTHRRIHIRRGSKGEATARALWGVRSICTGVWALQYRVGCGLHCRAYLGWIHSGQSWLGYCHLESGCAERCECAPSHGVHGWAYIEETLVQIDERQWLGISSHYRHLISSFSW